MRRSQRLDDPGRAWPLDHGGNDGRPAFPWTGHDAALTRARAQSAGLPGEGAVQAPGPGAATEAATGATGI